jgi:hypothetical protein
MPCLVTLLAKRWRASGSCGRTKLVEGKSEVQSEESSALAGSRVADFAVVPEKVISNDNFGTTLGQFWKGPSEPKESRGVTNTAIRSVGPVDAPLLIPLGRQVH